MTTDDDLLYLHGQSEAPQIRRVTILNCGVDHGKGAHSGNFPEGWRTTVVLAARLDYLKGQPITFIRLEDEMATEVLSQLATAVAIRERREDKS